ncbi:MAG: hypothetical protein R6X20_14855 [Phycisphaerae bacterium]
MRYRQALSPTLVLLAAAIVSAGVPCAAGEAPGRLDRLQVLTGGWPRAFFFRAAEGRAANPRVTYAQWEATFSRLMGIQGKCLDEEVPGRGRRNAEFFTRFKRAHPEQLVLLHYNGNARDPHFEREPFFAGHWIYYEGARVLSDAPAEAGETDIRVDHPERFQMNMGRYRDRNDDIGLCALGADGRPDWHASEQVRLVSIDRRAGTIRVARGCYGTKPRAFRARRAWAAAHATEGPWPRRGHLMWFYNYSTHGPRDADGRRCWEVHADDLAARFAEGGRLAAFDGVEFDVLFHERGGSRADCDADGEADGGRVDGVNTYGLGVIRFLERLRERMGEDRLVTADGHHATHQRGFGVANGIESEGWPDLRDRAIADWSGGLNRHLFWAARGRAPVYNYVNHKFIEPTGEPGVIDHRPPVPWSTHRLVFAAAVMTDSAICYSYVPPKEQGERFGIWDELVRGRDRVVGWLGRPAGPARRLALAAPDTLGGDGKEVPGVLGSSAVGSLAHRAVPKTGHRATRDGGAVRAEAAEGSEGPLRLRLSGVPCDGPDLVVRVTMRAAPLPGYPERMARLADLGIAPPEGQLVRREAPEVRMVVRGKAPAAIDPATGARFTFRRVAIGGAAARPAYFVHPPFRGCAGAVAWHRDVTVPAGGRLAFATAMGPKSPEKSDGVWFRVQAAPLAADGTAGRFQQIFEHSQKAHRWIAHEVPLAKWAGRRVRLRFVADCGPKDHTVTDHAFWSDVWVTGPGGREAVTRPVRYMTWADGEAFTSYAYFSQIQSETADLAIEVEGAAPVWIHEVTAHAAADAMVRAFENGIVLANPSRRAQTFDLADLAPGRRLRRLRGSSRQDPETNSGEAVGRTVTLGPKDGLFLVDTAAGGR